MDEKILSIIEALYRKAAHSIFSPSSSYMWLMCSGSLIPNLLADDQPTFESAEGTVAHSVGDRWLRDGQDAAYAMVGLTVSQDGFDIEIDENMLAYVGEYVDFCMKIGTNFQHYYETKTDISHLTPIPRQKGTADHFACTFGHLIVDDLKYGTGVRVYAASDMDDPRSMIDGSPNGNTQAMLYALGVFEEWDWFYGFERITIRICQPRLDVFEAWETTREELLIFAEFVKHRAALAWSLFTLRTPSTYACQWCKVSTTCPAIAMSIEKLADETFSTLEVDPEDMSQHLDNLSDALTVDPFGPLPVVFELNINHLSKILPYRKLIESWFSSINDHILQVLIDEEEDVPGYKLVQGRSSREFFDPEAVEAFAKDLGLTKDDIYISKFLSPNQLEERIHGTLKIPKRKVDKMVQPFVVKKPGMPTLARSNDNRSSLAKVRDVFEDLDQPENDEL